MTITVEDGSIVTGANSYVSIADARAYALQRGVTLSVDDSVLEADLIMAMDYIESFRDKFKGSKVSSSQPLQWPRQYVYIDGFLFDSDDIPNELISAQCQLAIDQYNGLTIQPSEDGAFIIQDTVGPITTKYSDKVRTSSIPTLNVFNGLMSQLMKNSGYSLSTIRV